MEKTDALVHCQFRNTYPTENKTNMRSFYTRRQSLAA